jgi:hypothetical protein
MKEIYRSRKGLLYILLLAVAFFFSSCCTCQNSPSVEWRGDETFQSQKGYVPDELFIKFKSEVQEKEIKEFLELHGFTVIKKIEGQEVYQVKIPGDQSVLEMVEALSKDPRIQYVEPNYVRSIY